MIMMIAITDKPMSHVEKWCLECRHQCSGCTWPNTGFSNIRSTEFHAWEPRTTRGATSKWFDSRATRSYNGLPWVQCTTKRILPQHLQEPAATGRFGVLNKKIETTPL